MHVTEKAYNGLAYAVSKHECSDRIDPSLYFLQKDQHVGNTMTLQFIKKTNPAVFLPRQVVRLFPFSSGRLAEILNQFSVKIGSAEADEIEKTLKICEMVPAFDEEHRQCMTLPESMINYATMRVGKSAEAIRTSVDEDSQSMKRNYTVKENLEMLRGNGMAGRHKINYPYAVYQCQAFSEPKAHVFKVPFKSSAEPKRMHLPCAATTPICGDPIFITITIMLKARPGIDPVCHFLGKDTIVETQQ